MVGSCDNKEGEVVAVLVGGAQGDRLGGVLVGAHDRLGLRHQSLLRRLKVRAELGNVAVGAARVPGETRISPPVAQEVLWVVFLPPCVLWSALLPAGSGDALPNETLLWVKDVVATPDCSPMAVTS